MDGTEEGDEHEEQTGRESSHAFCLSVFVERAIAREPLRVHGFAGIFRVGVTPTPLIWILAIEKLDLHAN
jgi:hypothetical protein